MEKDLINIKASEIADFEYCEVSWSFSNMQQGDVQIANLKKDFAKGSVAHQEHIRAEEALSQLIRYKNHAKVIFILFALGFLVYLLYLVWR